MCICLCMYMCEIEGERKIFSHAYTRSANIDDKGLIAHLECENLRYDHNFIYCY